MAHSTVLLGALLGLVLTGSLAVVVLASRPDLGPVYSVAQVQAGLADHPHAWVGRTVRVRAIAEECGAWFIGPPYGCADPQEYLTDPGPSPAAIPLSLAPAGTDPWQSVVRRVPLLGVLLPPPQAVRRGEVATYRVEMRARPDAVCAAAPCYEALLLDAAPDALSEG